MTAFVARATIEQVFGNPFDEPVEAVYTFPLGDRAAVHDFELQVGDRTIRGEVKPREEARAVYERARGAGFQAALLEQERPNVFTQAVANLGFDGEDTCFGVVVWHDVEFGFFSLAEITSARGPIGLWIKRDLFFHPKPFEEVRAKHR